MTRTPRRRGRTSATATGTGPGTEAGTWAARHRVRGGCGSSPGGDRSGSPGPPVDPAEASPHTGVVRLYGRYATTAR
ncbi:hypothetical protein ACWC2T_11100 [Streptomyces sp. NPDC001393]